MNIVVREYENSDLDSVNFVLKESFDVTKDNFNVNECKELVVCVDDFVCGYLLLTKVFNPIKNNIYYLMDYVCVSSLYRGLGLGKKLLEKVEEIAKKDNALYIQLTCSSFRQTAHKLYESCGYVKRDSDIFRKELL